MSTKHFRTFGAAVAFAAALGSAAPSAAQSPAQVDSAMKAAYDKYKDLAVYVRDRRGKTLATSDALV